MPVNIETHIYTYTYISIYKHITFDYLVSLLLALCTHLQTYSNMHMSYLQFIYTQKVMKAREIASFQRESKKKSDSTNLT